MTYKLSDNPSFRERVGVPSVQAVVQVGDTVSDIRKAGTPVSARSACSRAAVMGMTQAVHEARPLRKQAALLTVRGRCSEAGADDVLLNIEQRPHDSSEQLNQIKAIPQSTTALIVQCCS